jgi:hypothetical protein
MHGNADRDCEAALRAIIDRLCRNSSRSGIRSRLPESCTIVSLFFARSALTTMSKEEKEIAQW